MPNHSFRSRLDWESSRMSRSFGFIGCWKKSKYKNIQLPMFTTHVWLSSGNFCNFIWQSSFKRSLRRDSLSEMSIRKAFFALTVDCKELFHRDEFELIDLEQWCHYAFLLLHFGKMNLEPRFGRLVNNVKLFVEILLPIRCPYNLSEDRTKIGEKLSRYCSPANEWHILEGEKGLSICFFVCFNRLYHVDFIYCWYCVYMNCHCYIASLY